VVICVTTDLYHYNFGDDLLVLAHGESCIPSIRPSRTMDTVEFWEHLHSPVKKTEGERFINELNYSWGAFRRER
jgi:hypothetical protein